MDKRSWPWRKKTPERLSSSSDTVETTPSFPSTRHLDYQDVANVVPDNSQMVDDTALQWQENEETMRILNDKLSAALVDAASKELLAKQHAKLAEEAVSGWETVEAEAASLKQQLEATIQQKLATEDRVSHLDGALKECMRQLRNVREEQEENIHKAIMKKTREWDKRYCEFEAKYADLEQRFLEKDAENRAMSRSLQERARTICEISAACSKAQTQASTLQVRLESVEKEKAAFRYELNVTQKELDIRNEEKGLSRRAADAASKQHMEDIKRIAKLEAECQRLRTLLRKKLPGPGAIAQMKLEVDGLGSERNDVRRRSPKGVTSSTDLSVQEGSVQEDNQDFKVVDELWFERYSSLEEEMKMLREALSKRNNELQSARLMCARTASKLSSVEQQLESLKGNQKIPVVSGLDTLTHSTEPSLTSVSEDGNDGEASCAESWASALIAELDQFKKGKSTPIINKPLNMSKTDLDDFMEMEQLASSSIPCNSIKSKQHKLNDQEEGATTEQSLCTVPENNITLGGSHVKEAELPGLCADCVENATKLAATEEELARNVAEQAILKEKVRSLFEESANVAELLEQMRADVGLPGPLPERMRSLLCHGCCPDEMRDQERTGQQTTLTSCEQDVLSCSPETDHIIHGTVAGLTLAVCKVAWLVDELRAIDSVENLCPAHVSSISVHGPASARKESSHGVLHIPEDIQFRSHDTDARCQKLVEVSNTFLIGKVELTQLMAELAATLGHIMDVESSENLSSRSFSRKCSSCQRSIQSSSEMDLNGVVGSPMSDTSKSECSEAKIVLADENMHTLRKDSFSSEVQRLEEELRKAVLEKNALETHVRADYKRLSELEEELTQLKVMKKGMESTLKNEQEEAKRLKVQHHEAEEMVRSLQMQLASAESTKLLREEKLQKMAASKEELDSQLHICKAELSNLRAQMTAVAEEVTGEREKSSDLEAKCEELQDELRRSILRCPRCAMAVEDDEQTARDLEIAAASEKLAECERTILVLGHQLKALASPRGSPHQAVQSSLAFDRAQPDSYGSLRRYTSTGPDPGWDGGNSARFSDLRDYAGRNAWDEANSARSSEARDMGSSKKESPWDPRQSIASDLLDSELISLSIQGQTTSGRKLFNMFGDKIPVHEDYIEAVAQMPSSPEADPVHVASPKRVMSKPPRKKKRSPRSFAGVDMTKSMNDACSPSAEKQTLSSLTRFFSRARSAH